MPKETEQKNYYLELLIFFAPLATTYMLMMGSHSIISSSLARTENAAIALAAYSVANSIIYIFESPLFGIRRIYVALLDDKSSFRTLSKVTGMALAFVIIILLLVGYTPIGEFVFIRVVGVSESLFPEVIRAFRWFMILPLASALRSVFQSLLVVNRKTHIVTMNMILRLASMLIISYVLVNYKFVTGSAVGVFVLGGGMSVEAIMSFITARNLRKELPDKPQDDEKLTYKTTWAFYVPIMGALLLQNFIRPFINSGLARTVNPETALAAYQVAYSTSWILVGISFSIHQLVLVFVENKETFDKVKRFVFGVGIFGSALLLLMSLTPAGEWLLLNVIGTDPDITGAALTTMLPMAFIPLVVTNSEMFAGVLMMEKRTPVLTMSKGANLVITMIISLGVVAIYPELGALLAGISMLLGYVGEFGVVYFFGRKLTPTGRRAKVSNN
ncbi:MAG: hypothetical protein ACLFPS_03780 [Clostridia bacterium]